MATNVLTATKFLGGRQRTVVLHVCANPDCRKERWLQPSDAAKSTYCADCQRYMRNRKGFDEQVRRKWYTFERFIEAKAEELRDHSSALERNVAHMLDCLNYAYETQVPFYWTDGLGNQHAFIIDFVVQFRGSKLLLEVNGDYWHEMSDRQERDAKVSRVLTGVKFLSEAQALVNEPGHFSKILTSLMGD